MNVFRIDFQQLYRRHLCRHGHFGINVLHLFAVAGIYLPLFGIVDWCICQVTDDPSLPLLAVLILPWFATVALNVPIRVSLVTGLFVSGLLAVYSAVAFVPIWAWILLIPAMHRLQQASHRVYFMDRDMSEFEQAYPKGKRRFVLLLVYELPILLNYLLFGQTDWVWRHADSTDSNGVATRL